ncbi:MAG: hypothetical protein KUG79_10870 [Pseudomonadales bacterium]|nr:hypothetical protein [Pseudomonadales bacterium]
MSEDPATTEPAIDPAIFSRGSLKLTFDLIRKKEPRIALTLRNLTSGKAIEKTAQQLKNKNADFFLVELDSFEVRAIVEALVAYTPRGPQNGNTGQNAGMEIMAKALLDDWLKLASRMFTELPTDPRPGP